MPSDRVPQNSANSAHRAASSAHRRLLTDLQAVYQKIIHTSGSSFPFRAKDSRKSIQQPHKASSRYDSRRVYTSDSAFYNPRVQSACQSIEEIVITPLSVPEKDTTHESKARRNSTPATVCTRGIAEEQNKGMPIKPDCIKPRIVRSRGKTSVDFSTEYSEQSIRYVAEQVAMEQARQLKLHSNPQQHRIDRRYFVCGSKYPIKSQEFDEAHMSVLNENGHKPATLMLNKSGRIKSPPKRHVKSGRPQLFTLSRHQVVGSRIQSAHRSSSGERDGNTMTVNIPRATTVSNKETIGMSDSTAYVDSREDAGYATEEPMGDNETSNHEGVTLNVSNKTKSESSP